MLNIYIYSSLYFLLFLIELFNLFIKLELSDLLIIHVLFEDVFLFLLLSGDLRFLPVSVQFSLLFD
jgi:hypothetical protein